MQYDRDLLIVQIEEAFKGVTLEDGIGIYEALGHDSYYGSETLAEERARDERSDWTVLSADRLNGTFACFGYYDAKGMRFHLPAYLKAELNRQLDEPLVYELYQLHDKWRARFSLFSSEQKRVVCEILRFLCTQGEYEGEVPQIEEAIASFWSLD